MCIIENNREDKNSNIKLANIKYKQLIKTTLKVYSHFSLLITALQIIDIIHIYIKNTHKNKSPKKSTPNIIPESPKHIITIHISKPNTYDIRNKINTFITTINLFLTSKIVKRQIII